jgi:hypothetical protein|tara:strand:- start:1744 stop:2127 length:384 start_codon:yes stop_codon:yes gene_type:complete
MWFGLPALEGSEMAWGARAILDTRSFPYYLDLLRDRQGHLYEDQKKFDAFIKFLNDNVLPWIREAAGRYFTASDTKKFVRYYEYEGKVIVVQMTPNGSCGYMYISCSLVDVGADIPEEEYPEEAKVA